MATLGQITTEVYNLMNSTSDSSTYNGSRVTNKINFLTKQICRGEIKSLTDPMTVYKGNTLKFLEGKSWISKVDDTDLSSAVAVGAVTIDTDTTNLPSSGAVILGMDVITYTGKNATQLTGCDGVSVAWDTGSIRLLYAVPTDADRPFRIFRMGSSADNEPVEVPYFDPDYTKTKKVGYTIRMDDDGNKYFDILGYAGTAKFMVVYTKTITDLANDADISIIPNPFAYTVIAPLVAGELLYESEEKEEGIAKLQLGYAKLSEFYNFYNSQIKDKRPKVEMRMPEYTRVKGYGLIARNQIFTY